MSVTALAHCLRYLYVLTWRSCDQCADSRLATLSRRMLWWLLCPAALAGGVTATCGGVGLGLLVGQAAVGVLLLEVINYVEVRAFSHITRVGIARFGPAAAQRRGRS